MIFYNFIVNRFCLKRKVNIDTIINLDSILEKQENIEKIRREEKTFIWGSNGGKIGLVYQDILLSFYSRKQAIEDLSSEMGISEEGFIQMLKDLEEELKTSSQESKYIRFWTQKI